MPLIRFFKCENCDDFQNNCTYSENDKYMPKQPNKCTTCCTDSCSNLQSQVNTQKNIQKTVSVPSSQYKNNLASLTIRGPTSGPYVNTPLSQFAFVNQSQASDRNRLHIQRSIPNTKNRPGGMAPGGTGVDVKHNSFHRIMERRKAGHIKTHTSSVTPVKGNKTGYYGIAQSVSCKC